MLKRNQCMYLFFGLSLFACQGPQGSRGYNGANGSTGATGQPGATGQVGASGAVGATGSQGIPGVNGSNGVNGTNGINGIPGIPGTVVLPVQFCPGTPTYPTTFIEYGFCIEGKLYAVYSLNNGFLVYLPDGDYSSNAVGSQCSFHVSGCDVQ